MLEINPVTLVLSSNLKICQVGERHTAANRLMGVWYKAQWCDIQISNIGDHILFKGKVHFHLQKIEIKGVGM